MKKQLLIIGITLVLITVGLSGCTDNNNGGINNKFVGKWSGLGDEGDAFYHTITFYSDGLVDLFHETSNGGWSDSGTWESNETILTFNITDNKYIRGFRYTFTNSETLILTDNYGTITYKKS